MSIDMRVFVPLMVEATVTVPPPLAPSNMAESEAPGEPPVPPPEQAVPPPEAEAHLMPPAPPPPVFVLSHVAVPPTQKQLTA